MYSVQDTLAGWFPNSEIRGSKLVRSSSRHIAAYHVLHRLSAPRHPLNALKALDHSHCRCPPAPSELGRTTLRKDQSYFTRYCPIRERLTPPMWIGCDASVESGGALGQTFSSRCQTARSRAHWRASVRMGVS